MTSTYSLAGVPYIDASCNPGATRPLSTIMRFLSVDLAAILCALVRTVLHEMPGTEGLLTDTKPAGYHRTTSEPS